jgi:hypothetical protein
VKRWRLTPERSDRHPLHVPVLQSRHRRPDEVAGADGGGSRGQARDRFLREGDRQGEVDRRLPGERFEISFIIALPFLVIDIMVATIVMSMGMTMMPPTVISLPFKVLFFVLIDGWNLLIGELVRSFS